MPTSDYGYGENWAKWDDAFALAGQASGVDPVWLKGIAMNESSLGLDPRVAHGILNPSDAVGSQSFDGKSYGLMQLQLSTAKDFDIITNVSKLNDPAYSIKIASLLLKRLARRFRSVEQWCVKAYNQGAGNTDLEREGKIPGFAEEYWTKYLMHKELLK